MRPNNMQETSYNGDDSTLRKYRLALSAHKDYGDVFAANSEEGEEKADIMAQMVIAVNRVNEIFERDLGITLEFVENNDDLIFYRSEEHTSELQSRGHLVCRLLLEKKNTIQNLNMIDTNN